MCKKIIKQVINGTFIVLMTILLCACGSSNTSSGTGSSTNEADAAADDTEQTADTAELTENEIVFEQTILIDNDSFRLTAENVEVNEYGRYTITFSFENKTDTDWTCTLDDVYYNKVKSTAYASKNVAAGETATLELDDYDYGDVKGRNYIERVDVFAKIYDKWMGGSEDRFWGTFNFEIENTSTQPAMSGFQSSGNIESAILFENEYARVTVMDLDPEFSGILGTTNPCIILYFENLSDTYLYFEYDNIVVDGEELDVSTGRVSILPGLSAYQFWTDTVFEDVISDIDDVDKISFEIYAEENSSSSDRLENLINATVEFSIK